MEWMLQVIDEIDDAIGALRLCWVGLAAALKIKAGRRCVEPLLP